MTIDPSGITRRKFVQGLSAAGALMPFFKPWSAAARPADANRKICVFSKHFEWLPVPEMAQIVKEIGFDGVDLTVRPKGHVLPERVTEDLPRAVETIRKAGLDVYMITTDVTDPRDKRTEPLLRAAAKEGIRYYRTGYLNYDEKLGIAASLEKFRPMMRDLADMNRHYGLHGAYQNHAGTRVGGPVWDLWVLIRDLDPNYLGCQYDVRHAVLEGGYSWPIGMQLIAPFIRTVDMKDFKWVNRNGKWSGESVPLGEGMVDFKKFFDIYRQFGIQGPMSLHFEYPFSDRPEAQLSPAERKKAYADTMRRDLQKLRAMIAENGLA